MAEKQDGDATAEPSMEEILASIRKIIADEKDPSAPEAPAATAEVDDVLELTQMVQDDGSIVDLAAESPQHPVEFSEETPPAPPPVEVPSPVEETPFATIPVSDADTLVSDGVADVASSALSELAHKLHGERSVVMPSFTPLGNGAKTLEEMVLELMRPMLKAWLDQNLTAIVERIVQKEVERIARRVQD